MNEVSQQSTQQQYLAMEKHFIWNIVPQYLKLVKLIDKIHQSYIQTKWKEINIIQNICKAQYKFQLEDCLKSISFSELDSKFSIVSTEGLYYKPFQILPESKQLLEPEIINFLEPLFAKMEAYLKFCNREPQFFWKYKIDPSLISDKPSAQSIDQELTHRCRKNEICVQCKVFYCKSLDCTQDHNSHKSISYGEFFDKLNQMLAECGKKEIVKFYFCKLYLEQLNPIDLVSLNFKDEYLLLRSVKSKGSQYVPKFTETERDLIEKFTNDAKLVNYQQLFDILKGLQTETENLLKYFIKYDTSIQEQMKIEYDQYLKQQKINEQKDEIMKQDTQQQQQQKLISQKQQQSQQVLNNQSSLSGNSKLQKGQPANQKQTTQLQQSKQKQKMIEKEHKRHELNKQMLKSQSSKSDQVQGAQEQSKDNSNTKSSVQDNTANRTKIISNGQKQKIHKEESKQKQDSSKQKDLAALLSIALNGQPYYTIASLQQYFKNFGKYISQNEQNQLLIKEFMQKNLELQNKKFVFFDIKRQEQ